MYVCTHLRPKGVLELSRVRIRLVNQCSIDVWEEIRIGRLGIAEELYVERAYVRCSFDVEPLNCLGNIDMFA